MSPAKPSIFAEVADRPPATVTRRGPDTGGGERGRRRSKYGRSAKGGKKKDGEKGAEPPKLHRVLRCSVVTLTIAEGSSYTYAKAMLKVREEIKLSDLGIAYVLPKRTVTGGLMLEVADDDEDGRKASYGGSTAGLPH
jgi:hypothetical protein